MSQLDETIAWYKIVKANQQLAAKVVRDYTAVVPRSSPFYGLSEAEAVQLLEKSATEVDDLTVLALVSFFEQLMLDRISELLEQMTTAQLVSIPEALTDYARGNNYEFEKIKRGPFLELLKLFEAEVDRSLLDKVRSSYKYRNWVAHGKRGQKPVAAEPVKTYEALSSFLERISGITDPS